MTIPNGAHPAPDDPMDPDEILRRAEAFDPTPKPNREAIMRLALQMIVAQCGTHWDARLVRIQMTAEQALRECK